MCLVSADHARRGSPLITDTPFHPWQLNKLVGGMIGGIILVVLGWRRRRKWLLMNEHVCDAIGLW